MPDEPIVQRLERLPYKVARTRGIANFSRRFDRRRSPVRIDFAENEGKRSSTFWVGSCIFFNILAHNP